MIVQYKKEWDDCGTVRDIIETKNTATSFLFECVDDKDPGAVVVGTWKTPKVSGRSLQSWRVDLHNLRFVPIEHSLRFVPQKLAGNDDESDLAGWAKRRPRKTPNY